MSDVKKKVEAVLFSAGDRLSLEELSKLCRARSTDILASLEELQKEYSEKQSSLMIVNDNNKWKFSVEEKFIPIVRKVVTETELSKSIMETLAVIAFKYPILQSDLIKTRTNKAYDHLKELQSSGYISRKRKGRTNLIMLTDKFFQYFDLPPDKLKDKFKDFDGIAKAIEEKEYDVKKIKEEQKKSAEELKNQDEKIRKEIENLDKEGEDYEIPLKVYGSRKEKGTVEKEFTEKGELIEDKEKLGELEVFKEKKRRKKKADEKDDETKDTEDKKQEEKPPEQDSAVQEELDKMLHPEKNAK